MPVAVEERSITSAKLLELRDSLIMLGLPGTEYRVQLTLSVPASDIDVAEGKRIRGVIEANSLRVHPAKGGGQFIEPMWGAPRIVAGRILAIDQQTKRVLVQAAAPIWVTVPATQDFGIFREGELVNFYVESGASFTPVK